MAAQAKKILIVEDESLVSWSLSNVLKKIGCEITVAESGEQAIECLSRGPFDLVITDIKLPQINGFEVAARVKSDTPGTPVILISALADEMGRENIRNAQADSFLEKPFDMEDMTRLVTRLISSRPGQRLTG